jgi:hypothetical protein
VLAGPGAKPLRSARLMLMLTSFCWLAIGYQTARAGFSSASVRCKQTKSKYVVERYISLVTLKMQDAKKDFQDLFCQNEPNKYPAFSNLQNLRGANS